MQVKVNVTLELDDDVADWTRAVFPRAVALDGPRSWMLGALILDAVRHPDAEALVAVQAIPFDVAPVEDR